MSTYSGRSGSCSSVPDHVKKAYSDTIAFSESCAAAKLQPGKYVVINDYSGGAKPAMYVFQQDGTCVKAMPITWGVGLGANNNGRLEACASSGSHKTPPGMHITTKKNQGPRYGPGNSIALAGLSGQNSFDPRKILIHGAMRPGTASSWGCTGVPFSEFENLKEMLGVGSIVNNYFGRPSSNCSSSAGTKPTCRPESAAKNAQSISASGRSRLSYDPNDSDAYTGESSRRGSGGASRGQGGTN